MLEGHFIHPSDYAESKKVEPDIVMVKGQKEGQWDPAIKKGKDERDIVMVYCPSCGDRVDFRVSHPKQSGAQHQAINLLPEIATSMTWNKMDVVCKKCCLVLDVEPVIKDRQRVELRVKIDDEGMTPGTAGWYENFKDGNEDHR
jgi:hypothetical protein